MCSLLIPLFRSNHRLQIPSRLKIAVQKVLDETPFQQQQYHQEQADSSNGYAECYDYGSAQGDEHQARAACEHHSEWPVDDSSPADTAAVGNEVYYNAQEAAMSSADEEQQQYEQYSIPARAGYYDYTAEATEHTEAQDHTAELCPPPGYYDHVAAGTTEVAVASDQTTVESYYHYRAQHDAMAYEQIESEVVEAHAVVVEDATTYEEILAPMPQQWGCRQCTFLNPVSESFCGMCQDHISASPDMAGVTFPYAIAPSSASPMKPEQVMQPAYLGSQLNGGAGHTLMLAAHSTPPVSPLYSPSAPSYEAMDCEDGDDDQHQQPGLVPPASIAVLSPFGVTPAIPSKVAKQLAFQGGGASTRDNCEVIHPAKVLCQPPENYLALAFKGKAGASSSPTALAPAHGGTAAMKNDQVRREEDVLTEYSF